jgi:hypothetical protein
MTSCRILRIDMMFLLISLWFLYLGQVDLLLYQAFSGGAWGGSVSRGGSSSVVHGAAVRCVGQQCSVRCLGRVGSINTTIMYLYRSKI